MGKNFSTNFIAYLFSMTILISQPQNNTSNMKIWNSFVATVKIYGPFKILALFKFLRKKVRLF